VRRSLACAGALIMLASCGRKNPGGTPASTTSTTSPTSQADSLALRLANGTSIWFAGSRADSDGTGRACVEHVMQIRHDSLRIAIPLLYTGALPTVVDDTTIAADLWLHCQPGDRYLVDLRTGRPRRATQ